MIAPIAQWIERCPPEAKTRVRVAVGVLDTMLVRRSIFLWLSLLIFLGTASCTSKTPPDFNLAWVLTDMRALDVANAPSPSQDLVAIYTRTVSQEFQIRLDWLDHSALPDYDLYVALDSLPGGTTALPLAIETRLEWDTLLVIPASGALRAFDNNLQTRHGAALRIMRDPIQDILIISINQEILHGPGIPSWTQPPLKLQVLLTPAGSQSPVEQLGPIRSEALPPKPASVLLAFWNTYPGYTPALALRRWDGAHTGPLGGRHGLYNLLRTAQSASIPILLLDLKEPAFLSALDYSGHLELVQEMARGGLLILADPLPDSTFGPAGLEAWMFDTILERNRHVAEMFDLAPSPIVYLPSSLLALQGNHRLIVTKQSEVGLTLPEMQSVQVYRWRDSKIIPLPDSMDSGLPEQATGNGPSLELRRALIASALKANQTPGTLLVLGGNLPASTWGEPQSARATFHYLSTHPWVHVLDANGLLALRPSGRSSVISPPIMTNPQLSKPMYKEPEHPIHDVIWDTYLSLYAPLYPKSAQLPEMRTGYVSQIWMLREAIDWAAQPTPRLNCTTDPDNDGSPECVLASDQFLAIFEINQGVLACAFTRLITSKVGSFHQIIAPSSQFITGLSDPASWKPGHGSTSDPSVIPGTFADAIQYQVSIEENKLIFTAVGEAITKTFYITGNSLHIEYRFASGTPTYSGYIPLAIDPWRRFTPGWTDQYNPLVTPQGFVWQLSDGSRLQITSSADLSLQSFLDTRQNFAFPEDPNYDYPAGHFLPFPLILIEAEAQGDFFTQIDIIE